MDFDKVLNQWEHMKAEKRSTGKDRTLDRASVEKSGKGEISSEEVIAGETGGSDWLDLFPPSAEIVNSKDAEERPPVAEGRSIWLRRPHQDTLDLHGLNGKEAEEELIRFVRSLRRRGFRKGMVIHGKGLHSAEGSVLGPLVRKFLKSSSEISEFGHAGRKDGGSGATWFVLRQRSR